MRRARFLGMATLAVAALTLTACEKPAPGITVFSGTTSVRSEALCWAFDSAQLNPGECAAEILDGTATTGVEILDVVPGNVVGISVDPAVAEAGWSIAIGDNKLSGEAPLTTTYFRFNLPQFPQELGTRPIPMQITAGSGEQVRGVWIVPLQPGV